MKTHSLVRRVLGIVLLAQVICASMLCLGALIQERHTRLHAFDESLRGRTDSVLAAFDDEGKEVDTTGLKLPAADLFAVYDGAERVRGGSSSALVVKGRDGFHEERAGGVLYRVFQRVVTRTADAEDGGGTMQITAVYASPETHLQHEINEAAEGYALLIGAVLIITGLSVLLLLRITLRPLRDIAAAAGEVSVASLVFTPPPNVLALTELRPLAAALTSVMQSLREAFASEKRFVGDAAHELKTAVAVVRSTVQVLMLKRRSVEEHAAGLERVLEDVARVESLVAQMLNSSAMDETPWQLLPPLDLREVLEQTVRELTPMAEAQRLTLTIAPGGAGLVRLQPERASALISNLVVNAIQHSLPGGEVSTTLTARPEGGLQLCVADRGSGIGPEALPHVFERFFREDRSRSRATGGAGLGLAICKSIVEGNGGEITIASEAGRGTTVTVVFRQD